MQRMSWKKLVAVIVVLAAFAIAVQYFRAGKHASATHAVPVVQSVPVKVANAQRGDLDLSLKVIGRAEAFSTVNVQARVSGQLQSLLFTPGSHVNQGATIIRIDPSLLQAQLSGALGSLAKDEAQLINAQAVLKRYAPLLPKGYVSQSDYDTYKANVGVYEASVKADKATVELARTQLSYAQIQAPFESVAGAPLVYPGAQIVANATTIVVLNQIRPIHITFAIPETSLAGVKAAAARGTVPVTARVPGTTTAPLQAAVDFINNAVDTTTGTIQIKARYDNDDDRLTPGQFVEVVLPTTRLANVVTVPVVALQNSPKGSFVFVVGGDGAVQQRFVSAGPSSGAQVVIEKGLNGGESVVTDGQMLLVEGTHVRIVTGNG
ncbi:efflux RND transporter periplasmic adaptor subunit [Dyella tabacisoli]|uniref:Efflux RND transporter periplasmic adaptor subunit n=1 Tax=Dyella tabacisoli TaxID=2282381 RepID=A0A369UUD1_9GAMM|nr:efflux RND transporter periplasmic adaptor subunit [Dyella tabacisoli]RDD81949.1 efflux RND transporter periplasmic adaptor subunit [Dyella tabacisoli]